MSNSKSVRVSVRVLSAEEGGRHHPFHGNRYAASVSFLPDEGWSIVLDFPAVITAGKEPIEAEAWFLALDKAPWDKLVKGTTLDLYEGLRHTATAEVLP